MTKRRIFFVILGAAFVLAFGLLSGFAAGADGTDPAPTTTTAPTTTEPSTSTISTTEPISTTVPTSTVPEPTTTAPTTTADPPTGTITAGPIYNTTTAPEVTSTNTVSVPAQTITQTVTVAPPETVTTVPGSTDPKTTTQSVPPTAPCDTTAITCGNNASTQVALVSQVCNSSSANTTLNVTVQTLSGQPVNNVTISPTTSCLNISQITQIVSQYCVGCTVIVIPPPPPVIYVPVPGTNTVTTQTNTITQLSAPVRIMAYCMPKPVIQNGVTRTLLYLPVGTPQKNPIYAKAFPATFVPTVGMKCPGATANTISAKVPMFTLAVPGSFVGQSLKLCLQPSLTTKKAYCHTVPINRGAIISVPVTSNLVATVVKTTKLVKKVSGTQVKSATSALAVLGK